MSETTNETGKYVLRHGFHRGTPTSRDLGSPEPFYTYEGAYKAYLQHRNSYHLIGYQIWFAEIVAPGGKVTLLESNPYL